MNGRVRAKARVLAALMFVGSAAAWLPAPSVAQEAPYGGSAATDIVHVQALNIAPLLQVAEVALAPSIAEANSAGLPGDIGNSHARATNADIDLLSGAIDLPLLVEAEQTAPPTNPDPTVETLLDLPLSPLLDATAARATANAQWNVAGCVPVGTPIAHARSELADAVVLPDVPLVSVDNDQGDTVYSDTTVELFDIPGQATKGVKTEALTQVTGITILDTITINVLAPALVTAEATGMPGGASVTYSEPVLQVYDPNGQEVFFEINATTGNLEIDLSPLAILRLGTLDSNVADDGTAASGRAVLLEATLLDLPGALEPGVTLTIAGGEVTAVAPQGGVSCPGDGGENGENGGPGGGGVIGPCGAGNPLRELQIGPSTQNAPAGSTFTYTVAVSNRGECTLSDVRVEQSINGPPGSSVISTDPQADSVEGLTVTWEDIGPLDPGEVKVLVVTVQVPSDANIGDQYSSDVEVTATGDGDDFSQQANVSGPAVGAAGSGACDLSSSQVGPSHEEVLPGQTFNVYVSLQNTGAEPCPGVTVELPIDDGLEFVSCTHDCEVVDGVIRWTIPEIGGGSSLTLTATLRVPDDAGEGTVYEQIATIINGGTYTTRATGPEVAGASVLAAFPSAGDGADVGGRIDLPVTGFYAALMVAFAMALVATGLVLRDRSRSATG